MILSIVFPALTVLGTLPLLRWAISGEKADIFASLSMGLACLIGLVCAFGRPDEPFQFGMSAMIYAIGAASLLSLCYTIWLKHIALRLVCMILTVLIWGWIVIGMPINLDLFIKASLSGAVLIAIAFLVSSRTRWELYQHNEAITPFIALLVISGTLWILAWYGEAKEIQNFAIALCVICLGGLIWTIPKLQFSFHENALLPLTLSISALAWDMWLQGLLPIASLACLILVLFSRPAALKLVAGRPQWVEKTFYVVFVVMCLLPAFLSVVFFDIVRNL